MASVSPTPVRPRILLVDNSRAVTGALNALRGATNPLRAEFDFAYVLPSGSTGRQLLEAEGHRVYELPFVEISRRPADLLRYVPLLLLNGWRLRRLARQEQARLVHLNDFYNLTGYVARLLSGGQLRVITHVRFLPQALPQPLAKLWRALAQTLAQRVVCVSEAVRRYFAPGHPRVRTIYDPLPARGEQLPVPDRSGSTAGADQPVRLLYLSNFTRGKGQDLALRAFADAYAREPRLRLHFAGGDLGMVKNQEFRQELEAAVAAQGLGEVVTFAGFVQDTEALMKSFDIVLNFSEAESFSLTCLDALYFGVPLIATDCGGPAELFENGRSGRLVPNRDVPAMAAAMAELAHDAGLRARFAAAGRLFVRQKFAPAHTFQTLAACYRELLPLT